MVNFSDTLFNFEKFARNVAGYGNFEKNYKSLGTWQVPKLLKNNTSSKNVAGSGNFDKKKSLPKRGRFQNLIK